ncbi:hypothetical protein C8J56DRAFT_883482 [Mycena floridula]|nr:hypothetical protein C8J56DRAFT_883482 [Mycena floridula]
MRTVVQLAAFFVENILQVEPNLFTGTTGVEVKIHQHIWNATIAILSAFTTPPACNISQLPSYISLSVRVYVVGLKWGPEAQLEERDAWRDISRILFGSADHRNEFSECMLQVEGSVEIVLDRLKRLSSQKSEDYDQDQMIQAILVVACWDRFDEVPDSSSFNCSATNSWQRDPSASLFKLQPYYRLRTNVSAVIFPSTIRSASGY